MPLRIGLGTFCNKGGLGHAPSICLRRVVSKRDVGKGGISKRSPGFTRATLAVATGYYLAFTAAVTFADLLVSRKNIKLYL